MNTNKQKTTKTRTKTKYKGKEEKGVEEEGHMFFWVFFPFSTGKLFCVIFEKRTSTHFEEQVASDILLW